MSPQIPTWKLERYLLGELPPQELQAISQAESKHSQVADALNMLRRSNQEILQRHPPERVASDIQRRIRLAGPSPSSSSRPLFWVATAAAVALLLFVAFNLSSPPPSTNNSLQQDDSNPLVAIDDPEVGGQTPSESLCIALGEGCYSDPIEGCVCAKGALVISSTSLFIHRKQSGTDSHKHLDAEQLLPNTFVHSKDELQISYRVPAPLHGVILSIDGRGVVSSHFPADSKASTLLLANKIVDLPFAYELDDAPQFERFFFITSLAPISADQVLHAAETLAISPKQAQTQDLTLPEGLDQTSFLLLKEPLR